MSKSFLGLMSGEDLFQEARVDSSISTGENFLFFYSDRYYSGTKRLLEANKILNNKISESELLRQFGSYELEAGLVQKLNLRGLSLPASGEVTHLSPKYWEKTLPHTWTSYSIEHFLLKNQVKS